MWTTAISAISSAISFLTDNWKTSVIVFVCITAITTGAVYLSIDYAKAKAQAVEYEAAAKKWKENCEQAQATNEHNQKEIAQLKKETEKVCKLLLEKEQDLVLTINEIQEKENRIATLEKENEEVRTALSYSIPCELWTEIFPNSTLCRNKSGH